MASKFKFVGIEEFNGKPTFYMSQMEEKEDRNKFNTFSFQMGKAEAIVEHMEAIQAFVNSEGESIGKKKAKSSKASTNGAAKTRKRSKVAVDESDD